MKRNLCFILMCCVLVAASVSCDKNATEPENATIVGTWTRLVEGAIVTFIFTATTYEVDYTEDGERDVWGNFTLSGNQLTMNDTGGAMAPGPGVYTFVVTSTTLTFTLVSDSTSGRVDIVVGIWTRTT